MTRTDVMKQRKTIDPQIFCWCVWSACLTWALAILFMQGPRWPWTDEWWFVPCLTGERPFTWEWLWIPDFDHRIPVVKFLYFVLYALWPGDFRSPILLSIFVMAAASAVLLCAAKKLRGCASCADAFFPLLMMHMGLGTYRNGLEIMFALSTFFMCVIAVLANAPLAKEKPAFRAREALGLVLAIVILPLCGNNGLALSLGLIIFLGLLFFRQRRVSEANPAVTAILGAGILVILSENIFFVLTLPKIGYKWGALALPALFKTSLRVLMAPFGEFGHAHLVWMLSALGVFGGWLLLRMILFYRSGGRNERAYVHNFIAFSFSLVMLAFAVGYGRAGRGWMPGFAVHYSLLLLPLYAGAFLLAVRMRMSLLPAAVFCLISVLYVSYLPSSLIFSRNMWSKFRQADDALRTCSDLNAFVANQTSNLFFIDGEQMRNGVREGVWDLAQQSARTPCANLLKFRKFSGNQPSQSQPENNDRLSGRTGSSPTKILNLPEETRDIAYHFDQYEEYEHSVHLYGWATFKNRDSRDCSIRIVLKSEQANYVIPTMPEKRPDVTAYFKRPGCDDSGFRLTFYKRDVQKGRYRVCLYLKQGKIEALQVTDHFIVT